MLFLRANPSTAHALLAVLGFFLVLGGGPVVRGLVLQTLATTYSTVPGVVEHSRIVERKGSKGGIRYSLDLAYIYTVEGVTYTSTQLRYNDSATSYRDFWERQVADLPPGRPVEVFYNPSNPADAILSPGIAGADLVVLLPVSAGALLLIGGWLTIRQPREFAPDDPAFSSPNDSGWEARLPVTSHAQVFVLGYAVTAALGAALVSISSRSDPPLELVGATFAGAVGVAAIAAAIFSRYPVLVADLEAGELILPGNWRIPELRVPFAAISQSTTRSETKSSGKGKTYEVFHCELAWVGEGEEVRIRRLATYATQRAAAGLAGWVEVVTDYAMGRQPSATAELAKATNLAGASEEAATRPAS